MLAVEVPLGVFKNSYLPISEIQFNSFRVWPCSYHFFAAAMG